MSEAAALRARGLALLPELEGLARSPLERWTLPREWPLGELWVKRDDLLGEGGAKVRKLRVELGRARRAGVGVLTVGHLDSNHALATARAARGLGLRVELDLLGRPARDPPRAEILGGSADAVRFHRGPVRLGISVAFALAAARLRRAPLRFLPPGGTTIASTAAVAMAVAELVDDFAALGEPLPQRWAVAVGSGGTLAGLWAGVRALNLSVRILGVAASSRWVGPAAITALCNRTLRRLGASARLRRREVELDFGPLGQGHGASTSASREVLAQLGELGHPLDPIYTAKALVGLEAAAAPRTGPAAPGGTWLFWHTGVSVH